VLICFCISTIVGGGLIFVSGVVYGVMGVGKKYEHNTLIVIIIGITVRLIKKACNACDLHVLGRELLIIGCSPACCCGNTNIVTCASSV